jgi:hypothetical protein
MAQLKALASIPNKTGHTRLAEISNAVLLLVPVLFDLRLAFVVAPRCMRLIRQLGCLYQYLKYQHPSAILCH